MRFQEESMGQSSTPLFGQFGTFSFILFSHSNPTLPQLYLVGVNPEARNECEILKEDDFEYDTEADELKKDLFRRNSQRKSVNHQSAEKIAHRLSVGKSTKKATHREVKTTKADIKRFFSDLISNHVYPVQGEN